MPRRGLLVGLRGVSLRGCGCALMVSSWFPVGYTVVAFGSLMLGMVLGVVAAVVRDSLF